MDATTPSTCTVCGRKAPRGDLFGVEPDLLCQPCAQAVRERMFVRHRPLTRTYGQGATVALLAICVFFFVLTDLVFAVRAERPEWLHDLYPWNPIWDGEVWRHLTSVFLHGGWLHLGLNGLALWTLGRAVEYAYGPAVLVLVFVSTGLVGSVAQWAIVVGQGVGMSGALFGLAGFLIAQRRTNPVAAVVMNRRMINMLITWFLLCIVLTETGRLNIANWAHGGGLVWGLLIGWAAARRQRRALVPLVALATVALLAVSPFLAFADQGLRRTYYRWSQALLPLVEREEELVERGQAIEAAHDGDLEQASQVPEYLQLREELEQVRKELEREMRKAPPLPTPLRRR